MLAFDQPLPATILVLVAYAGFAVVGVALAAIDVATHRLPDRIVLPAGAIGAALLLLACLCGADWSSFARAAIGSAALFAGYFLLRLISPAGMGGGDVKLAAVVGLFLGWAGWGALVVGVFAAFLLGGLFGLALMLTRRAGRRTAIPFGPFMLVGAWIGIFAGDGLLRLPGG
jgi:leader peptidase (prepilin peptidase)/N-methyltransferase